MMLDDGVNSIKTPAKGLGRFGNLLAGIGISVSLLLILAIASDFHEMRNVWATIKWQYLVLIAMLAVADHGLRYWRWKLLLKRVAPRTPTRGLILLLIFGVGSLLILTPARLGETAKSVYAQRYFGISVVKSLPILIAERLSDVAVMALLASMGLFLLGELHHLLFASVILTATLLVFPLWKISLRCQWISRLLRRILGARIDQVIEFANSSQRSLLTPSAVGITLSLGTCAWIIETMIYFLALCALGVSIDSGLFMLALAVFPLASLGGSLSFLPGGLGATEGALIAFGILFGGLSEETAIAAGLISRAAILAIVILFGISSIPLLNWVSYNWQRNLSEEPV